jgi:hypothetical protein
LIKVLNNQPKFKAMLRRCQERKFLIEFDRRPQISERIAGFVLDFSDSLILLHLLEWNTFTLNGYIVIRVQDVKRQRVFDKKDYWQSKAVKAKKLKPIRPKVSVSTLEEAIQSASRVFPVISVEKEIIRDEACWIGRPAELTPKTISIHNLNTQAEWKGKEKFNLKDITRRAFGGGYETALALSAKKRKI